MNPTGPTLGVKGHLKFLAYVAAGMFVANVGIGAYLAVYFLSARQFVAIFPPQALLTNTVVFALFFRFANDMNLYGPDWVKVFLFIVVPSIAIVASVIYFVRMRSKHHIFQLLIWIFLSIFSIAVGALALYLVVPTFIVWGTFRFEASRDVTHGRDLLRTEKAIVDENEALAHALSAAHTDIYADYGNGGAVLSALLDREAGGKLTYYESFYLPQYFKTHAVLTGDEKVDSAKLMSIGDRALVFGTAVDARIIESSFPALAKRYLMGSYGSWISQSSANLKKFEVIDDSYYAQFYTKKVIQDTEDLMATDIAGRARNQKIIDSYAANVAMEDAQYKEFVTDAEKRYKIGCADTIVYYDCPEFRAQIDKNIAVIAKNRAIEKQDYESAVRYNKEIDAEIERYKKDIAAMSASDGSSLVKNQGEYSAAVTFKNDTIYFRYFRDNPVSGDGMRIMVHELLHLYSYSESNALPVGFNEGMTDYLATKAMGYDELDSIRAAGYPLEVQLVMALLEKIPYDDLVKIYFTKDEKALKAEMRQYFPATDYVRFMLLFDDIFSGTYHVNGSGHVFYAGLIDHSDVIEARRLLNLPDKKFNGTAY